MKKEERFEISGMTCNHCVMRVEKTLKAVNGVQSASVDLTSRLATVEYDSDRTDSGQLISAIEGAGYKAEITRGKFFAGK